MGYGSTIMIMILALLSICNTGDVPNADWTPTWLSISGHGFLV
jgi:hypothetical protein